MVCSNASDDDTLNDIPEKLVFYVNTFNNIPAELPLEERLLRFNSIISELDETDSNLKFPRSGYGNMEGHCKYGIIGEGRRKYEKGEGSSRSRHFESTRNSPSNQSIRTTTSLGSVDKESLQNKNEEKNKNFTEETETNNTQVHNFVLPPLLKERYVDIESTEEEKYRKSEFIINLLMSSLFPSSTKKSNYK